jgi:hypothetical protein
MLCQSSCRVPVSGTDLPVRLHPMSPLAVRAAIFDLITLRALSVWRASVAFQDKAILTHFVVAMAILKSLEHVFLEVSSQSLARLVVLVAGAPRQERLKPPSAVCAGLKSSTAHLASSGGRQDSTRCIHSFLSVAPPEGFYTRLSD